MYLLSAGHAPESETFPGGEVEYRATVKVEHRAPGGGARRSIASEICAEIALRASLVGDSQLVPESSKGGAGVERDDGERSVIRDRI